MKKFRKKIEVDYTPYHVRQQAWYMSLLKFYKEIEHDDKLYVAFGRKLLDGKNDQKTLSKLDMMRRKHNEKKKKEFDQIKKHKATRLGLNFRNIIKQNKRS